MWVRKLGWKHQNRRRYNTFRLREGETLVRDHTVLRCGKLEGQRECVAFSWVPRPEEGSRLSETVRRTSWEEETWDSTRTPILGPGDKSDREIDSNSCRSTSFPQVRASGRKTPLWSVVTDLSLEVSAEAERPFARDVAEGIQAPSCGNRTCTILCEPGR